MTTNPSQHPPAETIASPNSRVIGGRYRVQRQLKTRVDTETLLALDQTNGQQVVVKTTAAELFSASVRMRLEHEAHILSKVQKGWFAPLLDYGSEDDQVYLVMPFISGITLQTRLKQGALSVQEAIQVGRAILTALSAAHASDVLHRDVRPANIIVNEGSDLHEATLIDFGLAHSAGLDARILHKWVGTAQYLSPEAAGLLDQEVTACSDLYSTGIVLFECLAGRPPFEGKSVGEVLRQHMTAQPPELRSLGLSVPRVLDEVIQRLLRKDPRERYQTARAVFSDLSMIEESLRRGEAEPNLVVGMRDQRRTLTEPAFVGRGQELAILNAQLDRTQAGERSLVLLEAESGGGKSRLLQEFSQRGAQQGAWILRGQGTVQAAPRPFQLLAGVVEGLVATCRLEHGIEDRLRSQLGNHLNAACSAIPELGILLGKDDTIELGPESLAETRSIQALTVLLETLGTLDRTTIIFLDDCQWADQLTLKVLSNWQRRFDASDNPILLIIAFRTEEVPADHLLRSLRPALHLTLTAFQPASVRKLVESMAGPLPDEAVSVIERLAEGSPFMAAAALRGLVESGALVPIPTGWRVEPSEMVHVQSSRHAAAFLARRIELLPKKTIKLLSVGAVLGKEFDLHRAATLAALSTEEAMGAVQEAHQRHIIWFKSTNDRCAFIHDKLRQTLLDRLPESECRQLHLHAAIHFELESPDRIYDLAYHFDAAGESCRALPYALGAAEKARAQHALELAEEQYRIAQRGVSGDDDAILYRVTEGLGDVLMLRGLYPSAAECFRVARTVAENNSARAEIEGKLGELAFKQGNNRAASEALERSLRLLGRIVPSSPSLFLLFLVWEVIFQVMHTVLPMRFLGRRNLHGAETEFLAINQYLHLGRAYFFDRGKIPCLWAHLRAMNLAERYPPTHELGHAWATHAPVMSLLPWLNRGEAFGKKSLEIRKTLGDLWGQGQSFHYLGVVFFTGAKYDECIRACQEAVKLLERTGDYWEMNMARWSGVNSDFRKGDLPQAVIEAKRLYDVCIEMSDDKVSAFSLDTWSRASGGRLPANIIHKAMQLKRNDVQATAQVLLAEGVRLAAQREYADAENTLLQALEVCRKVGMMNAWVSPVLPWLATVRRLQWEDLNDISPNRRREIFRGVRLAVKQAIAVARKFQTDLPHALREAGFLAAMDGATNLARKHLNESLAVAERQGARFEHAQTLLARGRVGKEVGWPGAEDDLTTARQALRALGADFALDVVPESPAAPAKTATLSLVDRFDTVLDSGRKIASALSRDMIFKEVRDAARQLLRGERCLLLRLQGDDAHEDLVPGLGELTTEYSEYMANRAVGSGEVVVLKPGQAGEEVALLAGVRSALCAAIFERGKPAGCFYVDHRQVSGLFGDDEKRLASFIATIAGAALENAEGFAELRRLNDTLEQRVAERTAAAEKANRAKGDFLANMSHEIRTPMNGIIGMAELALHTPLTEQQHEYLDLVLQSAQSLLRLLNDILDFSKVEAGKLELESIEFPLRDTLSDAMHTCGIKAAEKGVELTYLVPPDVPDTLVGDPGRLRQIIVNLVGNGLKFTDQGEVVVVVIVEQLEELDDSQVVLHFVVSDTGIGIPVAKQQQIFEAFSQADTSTTRRYGGTGLGLAISVQLVKLMGGRLWVESEVGKGSAFHFTVRFGIAAGAPTHAWLKSEDLAGIPVLVVDDNNTNRRILADLLSSWGMHPTLASSGLDALSKLDDAIARDITFRLALLDVMMPEMDGFMLAERMRKNPYLNDCALIMLSSAGQDENANKFQELGIARYLIKPVKQSELRDSILRVLSTHEGVQGSMRIRMDNVAASSRSMRILLAEDGVTNQKVACGLLARLGHTVVVASNGLEAVNMFQYDSAYDLILMDIQMPEMDGYEATIAIRDLEKSTGTHVPIVAMTAHALKGDRERCLDAGMDDYLSKPIQPKILAKIINGIAGSAEVDHYELVASTPVEAIIDWDAALELVGGSEEVLSELMVVFFDETSQLLPAMRTAITQQNTVEVRRLAHTIKGAASCFAARPAVAAALRLEMIGRDGELGEAVEACDTLEYELVRLKQALTNHAEK